MRKKLITFVLLFISSQIMCYADDYKQGIVLQKTDGSEISIFLDDAPSVSMLNKNILIETSQGNYFIIDYTDIANMHFAELPDGIIETSLKQPSIFYNGRTIQIKGMYAKQAVSVFDIAGNLIATESTDTNGNVTMDVQPLTSGTYILYTKGSTYKFAKK